MVLVFNPVTKLSTYVFVVASEPFEGDPRPVIDPPVIATLLDACVDIVPRPKFVLEVPAFATSLKLSDAVSFVQQSQMYSQLLRHHQEQGHD